MKTNHQDYHLFSLLDNDFFIQWVTHPTEESDAYWENEFSKNEVLKKNSYTLKNIIQKLRVKEPELSAADKQALWAKIEEITRQRRQQEKKMLWRRRMGIAATITILLALAGSASLYLFTRNQTTVAIDYVSMLDDANLQSESISLILSNNQTVDIPDDHSNVTYDQTGQVNVNSKPIEETGNKGAGAALNTLIVPYGKTLSLTLNDGTKVWVNSGSTLIYPSVFEKKQREIYLTGEIYLDVIKDEERPFIIKTNLMDVNVLGTKLNVSACSDDPVHSVVLVTGAVSVKSNALKGDYSIYPGQMFSYGVTSSQVDIREVNVEHYTSWIHGYLLLQSENLDFVLRRLEKHFNIPIHYQAADFASTYMSGKLDLKGTIENALDYISTAASIHYQINDNGAVSIEAISKQ